MTIPTMTQVEAHAVIARAKRIGLITPVMKVYLRHRIIAIMRERNPGPRLYRLVESYR